MKIDKHFIMMVLGLIFIVGGFSLWNMRTWLGYPWVALDFMMVVLGMPLAIAGYGFWRDSSRTLQSEDA